MRNNNHKAFSLMQQLIPQTNDLHPQGCPLQGLQTGLMTPINSLTPEVQTWMKVICK